MSRPFSLIVTDTSPLFTLVLAGALDALLKPGLPVSIPDAVYIEATRVHGAPGAGQIVDWINDNLDAVRIVPTDLRELEAAHLIQSTDHILDQAAGQGRNVERQRTTTVDAAATRERLRCQLDRQTNGPALGRGVPPWTQG